MDDRADKTNGKQDPSSNVRSALFAEVTRLDDLIQAGFNGINAKIEAEIRRIDEKIKLQAEAAALLNFAESKRLDAIRAVDINAVAVASERATQQASVLANQVVASAETLRTLVASTAATVANQLAQLSAQLSDRIATLEKANYEGVGKGRVTDPQIEALMLEVRMLQAKQTATTGSGEGMKSIWQIIVIIVGFAITIYFATRK